MFLPVVMGLIPPILLLCYIYHIDKIEREPAGLIILIFILGVLSTIGAVILEIIGGGILSIFGDVDSSPVLIFFQMFLVVAPAEEFCKRFAVMRAAWKHPAFNYRFDAVLYCTASALGFAALENFLYIMDMDFFGSVFRLIPVHTICGIFMGVYLGQAKAAEANGDLTQKRRYLWLSFLIPVLIHGFFDFGVSTGNDMVVIGTFLTILVLTVVGFYTLKKSAREDRPLVPPGVAFNTVYGGYNGMSNPYQQPYMRTDQIPYQHPFGQPYPPAGQAPYQQQNVSMDPMPYQQHPSGQPYPPAGQAPYQQQNVSMDPMRHQQHPSGQPYPPADQAPYQQHNESAEPMPYQDPAGQPYPPVNE